MVDYIQLGGKNRPILYGNAAFKLYKQRTGKKMSEFLQELGSGETDVISDITYCALRVGEIAAGETPSEDFTDEMKVAIWIDEYPGGVTAFMERLVDSLPKPKAGEGDDQPGEAQTTGTGTN